MNSVGHTGADGFTRLANQALFDGPVLGGQAYYLVDDFVGQGGTLANLAGFIHGQSGAVLGDTVLTGKPYSAKLAPDEAQIRNMAEKLKIGGGKASDSASNALPGRKLVTSKKPRMLTPSEVELLRQDLQAALRLLRTRAGVHY